MAGSAQRRKPLFGIGLKCVKRNDRHVPQFLFQAVALSAILICTSNIGYAEYLTVTTAGQKNLGSSAAYSFHCEKENLSPIGGANRILKSATLALSPDDALVVRRQFQVSIHEKKIFSPSRNEWFDFIIDKKNCDDVAKTIPLILDALKPK